MKNTIVSIVAVIALVGCGDLATGDTVAGDTYTGDYTYVEGGIDYGSGTPLFCNGSTCTVTNNGEEPDAIVGDYDESYDQAECEAAGYFYCTVQDKCLNQRVDDASSSCGR